MATEVVNKLLEFKQFTTDFMTKNGHDIVQFMELILDTPTYRTLLNLVEKTVESYIDTLHNKDDIYGKMNELLLSETVETEYKVQDLTYKSTELKALVDLKLANKQITYKDENYKGSLKNLQPHGHGVLKSTKREYAGQFKDGMFEGKGVYKINGETCEGEFKCGRLATGMCKYTAPAFIYNGNVVDGKFDGKAVTTYVSGTKYEGHYKNDKKNGQGIYFFINGNRFEGEFVDGKRHGEGTMYRSNGRKEIGIWKNDDPYLTFTIHT
jgi:hypothetical protein